MKEGIGTQGEAIRGSRRRAHRLAAALLLASLAAGCGGGGDEEPAPPEPWSGVTITDPTEASAYSTDARYLSLGGFSFVPGTYTCTLIGGALPAGYSLSWRNEANGETGGGVTKITCLLLVSVLWTTYWIPLEPGDNRITVTVSSAVDNRTGSDTITVTRVPDVTPPTVAGVTPQADSVSVPLTTSVVLQFSEAVDPASIGGGNLALIEAASSTAVPVSISQSADKAWATMTPAAPLNPGSLYEIRVAGVTDLAGNEMVGVYSSRFSTAP